jgi:hypothetical protein
LRNKALSNLRKQGPFGGNRPILAVYIVGQLPTPDQGNRI